MVETGIIRRIDDLGRVVIPKELRNTLCIKEGDPLEIFTQRDCIIFRKYSEKAVTIARAFDQLRENVGDKTIAGRMLLDKLDEVQAEIARLAESEED